MVHKAKGESAKSNRFVRHADHRVEFSVGPATGSPGLSIRPPAMGASHSRSDQRRWSSRMREYEVMVIFDPDTEERTVQPTLEKHLKVITKGGGTVANLDIWGRRRLAYEIRKKSEGIYAVINLTAPQTRSIDARSTDAPACSTTRAARTASLRLSDSARSDAANTSTLRSGTFIGSVIPLLLSSRTAPIRAGGPVRHVCCRRVHL